MAFVQTAIISLIVFSFSIGQIIRPNFKGFSFPVIDITIIIFALWNFYCHIKSKRTKNHNLGLSLFLIYSWCLLGIIFFLNIYSDSIKPFFYLLRITCLLSFFIFPPAISNKQKHLFSLGILANISFGLIQYFFWPDFTYFNINNWDPHLYRLVSSFFDPTFTGIIYLFFFIKIFINKKTPYRWPLIMITYIAIALTYSRSTYLSLIIAFAFLSLKLKNIKPFLFTLFLVIATIFLLPRQPGEGTKLERTSSIKAKIENYQQGLLLFQKNPIFGIGYNNLPLIKHQNESSHANGGFDSSFLTIFITTGVIGGSFFIYGFKQIFYSSKIIKQTCLIALLIHSLFANSLLYPWVLIFLVFL